MFFEHVVFQKSPVTAQPTNQNSKNSQKIVAEPSDWNREFITNYYREYTITYNPENETLTIEKNKTIVEHADITGNHGSDITQHADITGSSSSSKITK